MAVIQRLRSLDETPGPPSVAGQPGQMAVSLPASSIAEVYVADGAGVWQSLRSKWFDVPQGFAGLSVGGKVNAAVLPLATEAQAGALRIATQAETNAAVDDQTIVTPLKMATYISSQGVVVVPATETQAGIAEIATQAETDAGLDDGRIVSPLKLAPLAGRVSIAETNITNLQGRMTTVEGKTGPASEIVAGIAELATQAEANAGTDDARILTSLKLRNFTGTIAGPVNIGGLPSAVTPAAAQFSVVSATAATPRVRIENKQVSNNFAGLDFITGAKSWTIFTREDTNSLTIFDNVAGFSRLAIDNAGVVSIEAGLLEIKPSPLTTGSAGIEVGAGRTGDGSSYVDLISDTAYPDHGARFIRYGGANGATEIRHRGTGDLLLHGFENSAIVLRTNGVDHLRVNGAAIAATRSITVDVPSATVGVNVSGAGVQRIGVTTTQAGQQSGYLLQSVERNWYIWTTGGIFYIRDLTNPGNRFSVEGDGSIGIGGAYSGTGASNGKRVDGPTGYVQRSSRTLSTAATHYDFFNPNGGVGFISTNGSATAYSTASDGRLKENLRDFDSGALLDRLAIWKFNWKRGGTLGYGVVAQEAYKVFPDAVTPGDTEAIPYWGTDYSKFVPLLLREVQSLRARLAAVEGR